MARFGHDCGAMKVMRARARRSSAVRVQDAGPLPDNMHITLNVCMLEDCLWGASGERPLGGFWELLGAFLGLLGATRGRLGSFVGASGGQSGVSGIILGRSWVPL